MKDKKYNTFGNTVIVELEKFKMFLPVQFVSKTVVKILMNLIKKICV